MAYSIEYHCCTHVGKCRGMNQDNYSCNLVFKEKERGEENLSGTALSRDNPVFGVFDGLGGEEKGEEASYIAANTILESSFEKNPETALRDYCKTANEAICSYMKEQDVQSMGTTAAILLFHKYKIHLCNIGDSKIFRLSKGVFHQLSQDHLSIAPYGMKPPLLQYLGIPPEELIIAPYLTTVDYQDDDIYLICSDGLTDMVSVDDIKKVLETNDCKHSANKLLDLALENGGRDNITIIVLHIRKNSIFSLRRKTQ